MSARVCTTVFGYRGGTEITRRHLPIWREQSDEVILVYPVDSPSVLEDVHMVAHGKSNKYGEECLRRQLFGMRYSLRARADCYVFVEYDAFMLQRPVVRPGLQANGFYNESPEYSAKWYFHFPWVMDAGTLELLAASATLDPFERGFVDRWLGAQAARQQIPFYDFQAHREGYSRNTIRRAEEIAEVVQLAQAGAYAFHGIKTDQLRAQICEAYTIATCSK